MNRTKISLLKDVAEAVLEITVLIIFAAAILYLATAFSVPT
jgi:hypothetical protein